MPVAFYYKPELDDTQTRQYGLVAEEVAKVAPELVVFNQDGTPETVRYHFVNAMLAERSPEAAATDRGATESQRRTKQHHRPTTGTDSNLAARMAKLEALLTAKR